MSAAHGPANGLAILSEFCEVCGHEQPKMRACQQLRVLDLRMNGIDTEGFVRLAIALRRDEALAQLEDLDLSMNDAKQDGGLAIGKAFRTLGKRNKGVVVGLSLSATAGQKARCGCSGSASTTSMPTSVP